MLLRGDYREQPRTASAKTVSSFLKKRREAAAAAAPQSASDQVDAARHELVEGEVCAICQEDMGASQALTFCRKGCGNNFHIECMKVFGESRKQSKENIICPLCRHDWGDLALASLKKEIEVANRAPNVHKHSSCTKCQTKPIRSARYLCVQCKSTNLCERCFKAGVHSKHFFVVKQNATDSWAPAVRASERQERIRPELVDELQSRELSNNDYDLLLQLDQSEKFPIQDYLLSKLGGERVSADAAKSVGEPGAMCSLCRQSLRMHADLRSIACGVRRCRGLCATSLWLRLGHSFHESCLARSILSQVYCCPHPGCEHVLFPGLHHLLMKECSQSQHQGFAASGQQTALPALDCAVSVLSLQQRGGPPPVRRHPSPRRYGTESKRKAAGGSDQDRRHSETLEAKLPPMVGLRSLGIGRAAESSTTALSNQRDAERRRLPKPSTSQAGVRSNPGLAPTLPRHAATAVPQGRDARSLPPLVIGESSAADRMNQAERTRVALLANEKKRLRKQRLQREERSRHASISNQCEMKSGLGADGFGEPPASLDARLAKAEENRSTTHKRSQDARERKRGAKADQQRRLELQQQQQSERANAATADDLFVGVSR
ncbi:hypothetical protein PybrP1_007947 [[Pythium] brassicae (nom. inval.)]|nr:hypothetical protein PybrP1_007947 [[Pythium] brassicae (nom. inval.)]